jgi:hypothetical protein
MPFFRISAIILTTSMGVMNMHQVKAVKTHKQISRARLIRTVASSSAIETREAIELIELKLKNPKPTFKGIRLQLAL